MSGRFSEAVEGRYYNAEGCPVDAQGRHMPHQISMRTILNHEHMGRMLTEAFQRRVPESHWEEEGSADQPWPTATVHCTCGYTTSLELGTTAGCVNEPCPRYFWYSGSPGPRGRRAIFVAYVPDDAEAPKPQTPAAS